ncbi:MAG: hypothetical protein ABL874_10020 [Sphingopyxis sp.]
MGRPTLFMLCDEPQIADPLWLGDILSRCGFLGDGDSGCGHDFPIKARYWATSIDVTAGFEPAAQLAEERCIAPAMIGLDILPEAAHSHVLALTLPRPPVATRPQAVQHLAAMAAALSEPLRTSSLFWPPAVLWSNAAELTHAVITMERHGLPPVLHFVAFVERGAKQDEASCAAPDTSQDMCTRGLEWMVGHEVLLSGPLTMPRSEMLRCAARLAVDAMVHGAYSSPTRVAGLTKGEVIDIAPVDSSGAVRIVRAKVTV